MQETIKIFGSVNSRTIRCLWLLEELGLEYEHVDVDFSKGEHRSPWYLKLNPFGRVPALRHGDLVMFESAAICTFLADRYSAGRWVPHPGTPERAMHDQWMYFLVSEVDSALWNRAKHKFALPKDRRVPEVMETAVWELHKAMKVVEGHLRESTFLCGPEPTVSDIMLSQICFWARGHQVDLPFPRAQALAGTMRKREAFRRVKALAKG